MTMNITNIIKRDGFYVSEDIISEKDLEKLKNFLNNKLIEFPNRNFRLYEDSLKNSIITDTKFEEKINNLINKVLKENDVSSFNRPNYKVLRIVSGKKQKKQAYLYHFDAHLITILIPILIPNNKNNLNGDLVLFPNLRKLHKNILLNIIQKIFFQNILIRRLLSTYFFKKLFNYKFLKIKPGNLYMFFGFNSLHGNLEIEESSTRATLLIHAYDVFEKSKIVKINRDKSIKKEIKNIKA